jgi:type II secretory pathway pseudopilin PulG
MYSRTEAFEEGGFLLLEALIALAIIGVVAIALLAATSSQIQASGKGNALLVASALAQDRLAAIQMLDGDELRDPPDSLATGTFPPPFDEFSWATTVESADNEYELFAVRIVVDGRGESFGMETLLHRSSSVLMTVGGQ